MKKIKKYLGLFLLAWMTVAVSSCIKDNFSAETPAEKANITINIGSRATDDDNSEVKANEDIQTLRLILVQEGKIVINSLYDYSTEQENVLNKSIYIIGLKAIETDFYAIVNEASVARDFTDTRFPIGATFDGTAFRQAQLASMDKVEKALPMAGSIQQKAIIDGENIEISVTRAVARIDLNVINKTGSALDVSKINFGNFFPTTGYLTNQANASIDYEKQNFAETSTIENTKSQVFTYYLYESQAPEQDAAYKVGMNDSPYYPLTQIYDNQKQPIKAINRNTILKIDATANARGWKLQCIVDPWDKEEYNQYFDNTLSYSSEGWVPGTIAAREDNIILLTPDATAELQFTLQSPNTVTWVAKLDDNVNFKLETPVGENIFGQDDTGKPIPITQSVKISLPVDGKKNEETTLHVYAVVGGNQYEMDLTDDVAHGGEEGEVKRFIIRRGDQ